MGTQVHATRPGMRAAVQGMVPGARAWGAVPAGGATAGGGHDFARIRVSAPAADRPIQRVKSTKKPPKSKKISIAKQILKAKKGSYSQAGDVTVRPHLRSKAGFMGHAGALKQAQGFNALATEIREAAEKADGRRFGAGLHEVVPTNMRDDVTESANPALIGAQSGMRTSTDMQLFSPEVTGTGHVAGHTGFFRTPSGQGSTHTQGQAAAHDFMRAAVRSVKQEKDPAKVLNTLLLRHLKASARGDQVLASGSLTGAVPNRSAFGAIESVADAGKQQGKNRLALAQNTLDAREEVKLRGRSLKRALDPAGQRLSSPSPPRTPIDSTGKGGGYVQGDRTTWAVKPVPTFEGSTDWEKHAETAAWLTQPQRYRVA